MITLKKCIKAALSIKEMSAEGVRNKSIRQGYFSMLDLWWVRKALPVCRAVEFANFVQNTLGESCRQAFLTSFIAFIGPKNNQDDLYPLKKT
jgi:putative DNA methylase